MCNVVAIAAQLLMAITYVMLLIVSGQYVYDSAFCRKGFARLTHGSVNGQPL
jgi:hypothetical protein